MNERLLREILDEIAAQEVPASIDLWPNIHSRLATRRRIPAQPLERNEQRRRLAWAAGGLAALILAVAFLLATPQGRAIAQQVLQLFTRSAEETFPIDEQEYLEITAAPSHLLPLIQAGPQIASQAPNRLPVLPGCEDPAVSHSYRCQVAAAEKVAGFDVLELPADPPGLEFEEVRVDLVNRTIMTVYGGDIGNLILIQGQGAFPAAGSDWEKVPASEVQPVQVGGYPGEYVSGGFIVRYPWNQAGWEDLSPSSGRLAWQAGKRWFELQGEASPDDPDDLALPVLLAMAESLTPSPPVAEQERIRPGQIHTLAEAEQLAGFDLKAPQLLPLGYRFERAQYLPGNRQVRLEYQGQGILTILETPSQNFDYQRFQAGYRSAIPVEINNVAGKYLAWEGSSPAAKPFDEALFWEANGVVYRVFFVGNGGRLGQEGLLALAESLDDPPAADPQRDRQALADSLAAYEQLLGFELLEFSPAPAGFTLGWIYGGIKGDTFLFEYWSLDGRARLAVWQGRSEPPADGEWESIPSAEIETVQVGSAAGQYVRGEFLDDRSSPWAGEKPVQRLRWQDGTRWVELVLEGESPAAGPLEKPGLVELAESLR